ELKSAVGDEPIGGTVRKNKRPAGDVPEDEATEESEGFDTMDVDAVANAGANPNEAQSGESDNSTPEPSDHDDEDDDDLDAPVPATDRPRTRAMDSAQDPNQKSLDSLPPRRDLPFQKKTDQQGKV
ncbi:hypothetical protein, partial [Klebsiella pneumoniae]|uniref:hypothetical protein n=1 Tax=Klebsiella pneumoniae TaxID=573 RepID=UPI001BB1B77E